MPITKRTQHTVTVLSDGQLQVREETIIEEDGVELTRTYHRSVVDVGDDVSTAPAIVQELAAAVHTPERKAARSAARDATG